MKRYAPYALSLVLSLIMTSAFCQSNTSSKPKQFSSLPDAMSCGEQELMKVFYATPGQTISIPFSNTFTFTGTVKANITKYANLQSAIVVSQDNSNTIFNVSRITKADGTVSYIGRIINKGYFDGFELKKNASGNYQLKKVESDRVIQDCNMN